MYPTGTPAEQALVDSLVMMYGVREVFMGLAIFAVAGVVIGRYWGGCYSLLVRWRAWMG